jgi:hypothetical protein
MKLLDLLIGAYYQAKLKNLLLDKFKDFNFSKGMVGLMDR